MEKKIYKGYWRCGNESNINAMEDANLRRLRADLRKITRDNATPSSRSIPYSISYRIYCDGVECEAGFWMYGRWIVQVDGRQYMGLPPRQSGAAKKGE